MTPSAESTDDMLRVGVKAELRKRMRGLRKTTPQSVIATKSAVIVNRLTGMSEIFAARGVALFWPIEDRHELDLRALDVWLREKGKKVAYPSIDPETRAMVFRWVASTASLEERGLGFAEPAYDAPCASEDLDVVVVPALAIDPSGFRLGYGAGFYDRSLRQARANRASLSAIGVAFEFQYVSELPALAHDERLDFIVTDARCDRAT